jgi:hypothetical protein
LGDISDLEATGQPAPASLVSDHPTTDVTPATPST